MLHDISCPYCRQALTVPHDAPARGLSCPRCLAPLPDRLGAQVRPAHPTPSSSRLAGEEFVNQGRRDTFSGGAAIGGVVVLCVFGLLLVNRAAVNKPLAEQLLPLFGLFDLAVVSILSVFFTRGLREKPNWSSSDPWKGCVVALILLAVLGAGFVCFFIVCFNVVLSGPFH